MEETGPGHVEAREGTMRAIVYEEYGSPDVLALREVERPTPKKGEVLVRVHAAAVNPGDWYLLQGTPLILRLAGGVTKPRRHVLGLAVAGRVDAVGEEVSRFEIGEEVFGEPSIGGFAEYVCVAESRLASKPSGVTFEQAASVPVVGTTALQALRDTGEVTPGQKVLITGASGGVGVFAVQVAKGMGAEVTGVCSTANVELVRSLGADHVVDYTREDFTTGDGQYDLILDNVGKWALSDLRRVLASGGMLIPNANTVGGFLGGYLRRAIQAMVVSPFVSQKLRPVSAVGKAEDLTAMAELVEAGTVTPVIDHTYPLEQAAAAIAHYGKGHTRGKVVIAVA